MREIIFEKDNILLDQGSFFGRGVFETICVEDSPLFLEEHIKRMKEGMEVIGLSPLEEEQDLLKLIKGLDIKNKALKITVTPLNIIISTRDIPYKKDDYKKGMTLCLSDVIRNSTSRLTYIKSTCYVENLIEKEKSKNKGFDDALFLNEKGFLTETSCSNIFIVKEGRIFTPKEENGLLRGIIRTWIKDNYKVYEEDIKYEDLKNASEVFITNSLMGIMKVTKIDNFTYGKEEVIVDIINNYNKANLKKIGG